MKTLFLRPRTLLLAVLLGLLPGAGPADSVPEDALPFDADAVLRRTFENLYGPSSVQRVDLHSKRLDGRAFTRRAEIARRGSSKGLNRMLVRMLGPGDLRGVGLLLHENDDFSYEAFLYQPAYRKVRRITVAQREDALFGTDLVFEDLEAKRASQWKANYLRDENTGGREAWVIEIEPDGVPSAYDRVVGWFDKEIPIMLRAEFFNDGEREKVLEVEFDRVVEVDGHMIPGRFTVHGSKGSSTVVEVPVIHIREKLPDRMFSQNTLELGSERMKLTDGD